MWRVWIFVLVSASIVVHSEAFKSKCYRYLGCFNDRPPWDNNDYLPSSPDMLRVKYKLFTRDNLGTAKLLDYKDETSLTTASFDASKPVKFVIHGYLSHTIGNWVEKTKDALLKKGDFNVVEVDWSNGAQYVYYGQAVANVRLVAKQMKRLLGFMVDQGLTLDNVHLIGHSIGAHCAGYVGYLLDSKIGRISALDAAAEYYKGFSAVVRVDPTDAVFVDAIHSDAKGMDNGGFGLVEPYGHVDFYPNGGKDQPGCGGVIDSVVKTIVGIVGRRSIAKTFACSHVRSHELFLASINSPRRFKTFPCESYEKFQKGQCSVCGQEGCGELGYAAEQSSGRGRQYLMTLSEDPYWGIHYKIEAKVANLKGMNGTLSIHFIGTNVTSVAALKTTDAKMDGSFMTGVILVDKDVSPIQYIAAYYKHTPLKDELFRFMIEGLEVTSMETGTSNTVAAGIYLASKDKGVIIPVLN